MAAGECLRFDQRHRLLRKFEGERLHAFTNLGTVDAHVGRSGNADPHFVAVDRGNSDRDAAIDDDGLAGFPCQYEHGLPFREVVSDSVRGRRKNCICRAAVKIATIPSRWVGVLTKATRACMLLSN